MTATDRFNHLFFGHSPRQIGARYLVASALFFALGGTLALLMRWQLAWPGRPIPGAGWLLGWPGDVMPPEYYAQLFTMHATVMIWLVIVPALAWGFGALAVPTLVNRKTLALPRLAGLSFWWMIVGAAVLLVGWSGAGWTAYAPLATQTSSPWIPVSSDWLSWLRLHATIDGFAMQRPWSPIALLGVFTATLLLCVDLTSSGSATGSLSAGASGLPDTGGRAASGTSFLISSLFALLGATVGTFALQLIVFDGQTAWFFAVGWWGIGGLMISISLLTTLLTGRIEGRLALAGWGWGTTAVVALLAGPVLVVAMIMNLMDAHGLTSFFDGTGWGGGGTPLLHQHLFWFYGHPVVYIMILPAFGIVTDTLADHSTRPVYGYRMMVWTTIAIGGLGFLVWAHHMFQSGLDPSSALVFSAASMLIAVPSALKTVGWLGTIVGGRFTLEATTWAALAFISLFIVGGLSGVILAAPALNLHLHDTYFVVAHLHYTLFGGSLFGIFLAVYRYWPYLTGRRLSERVAKWHLGLTYLLFNTTFGAMHILGMQGMPRRYADTNSIGLFERYGSWQQFMTFSAFALGAVQLLLLWNILRNAASDRQASRPER